MWSYTEAPPSVPALFGGKLLRRHKWSHGSDTVNTPFIPLPCMSCSVETTSATDSPGGKSDYSV